MYSLLRYLFVALMLTCGWFLSSCHDEVEKVEPAPIASHTVLMYLISDNDIDKYIQTNPTDAGAAIRDSVAAGALNLVIFNDRKGQLPELYCLRRNSQMRLDTIRLKTYASEVDAASPEVFRDVLSIVFDEFGDSDIKGVTVGSHALGWTPSAAFSAEASSRATQYIGYDDTTGSDVRIGQMDIWDFAEAIRSSGIHLDYLVLDACNMANVEVAYQLHDVADYLVASVTEILGEGFPYEGVITELSRCQSKATLPQHISQIAHLYYEKYLKDNTGVTVGAYDLTKIPDFADAYFSLLGNSSRLGLLRSLMEASKSEVSTWQKDFQQFGRSAKSSAYCFYDLGQWLDYLAQDDESAAAMRLTDVVMANYSTTYFFSISINSNSGLTASLPPCFQLVSTPTPAQMTAAYRKTQWGERTMGVLEY